MPRCRSVSYSGGDSGAGCRMIPEGGASLTLCPDAQSPWWGSGTAGVMTRGKDLCCSCRSGFWSVVLGCGECVTK